MARKPLGASGTSVLLDGPAPHPLERLLDRREVRDVHDRPGADDVVRRPVEDRRHELRDVGRTVLVVRVRVHDDVGAEAQAGVHAGHEDLRQSAVALHANDVVDTVGARDLHGPVGAAVVDDQPLDHVHALEPTRKLRQSDGERLLFVEARDLDDELDHELVP
jgi:hypothetical protein